MERRPFGIKFRNNLWLEDTVVEQVIDAVYEAIEITLPKEVLRHDVIAAILDECKTELDFKKIEL